MGWSRLGNLGHETDGHDDDRRRYEDERLSTKTRIEKAVMGWQWATDVMLGIDGVVEGRKDSIQKEEGLCLCWDMDLLLRLLASLVWSGLVWIQQSLVDGRDGSK